MAGPLLYVCAAMIGILAGFIIGCVGVGGVTVVPLLMTISAALSESVDVREAVKAALFSYCFTGTVGTLSYARKGSVRWRSSLYVVAGAAPAAATASAMSVFFGAEVVVFALYSIMIISSLVSFQRAWQQRQEQKLAQPDASKSAMSAECKIPSSETVPSEAGGSEDLVDSNEGMGMDEEDGLTPSSLEAKLGLPLDALVKDLDKDEDTIRVETMRGAGGAGHSAVDNANVNGWGASMTRVGVGFITGFLSAMSGTAGPVVLLPLSIALKWDILDALGAAQMVQLPIGLSATIVNAATTGMPWQLGLSLGLGAAPAVFLGSIVAHHLPRSTLTLILSCLLFCAGIVLMSLAIVAAA